MNTELHNTYTLFINLAAVYNCNTYGSGSYDVGEACTTGTDGGSNGGSSGGSLVDTGINFILPLVIGLVLIVGPAVYFIRRKMSKKQQASQQ